MTLDTTHDPLGPIESRLEAMTQARPSGERWRAALLATGSHASTQASWVRRAIPNRYLAGFVAVIALALCVGILMPSLGKTRSSSRRVAVEAMPADVSLRALYAAKSEELTARRPPAAMPADPVLRGDMTDRSSGNHVSNAMRTYSGQPARIEGLVADQVSRTSPGADRSATPLTRHVVRKATIDLSSSDVRVAASKAAFLVNEAAGEYVETSNIYGQDKQSTAQLTIRVVASRLSEVMGQLRELGTVVSETADGKDVSEQVVDIEARLRNETRIEEELLKLLAARESAPLAEILDLRKEVNASRERIERLTAQRDGLYRLTSLATILVTIRHDWKEPEVAAVGWWTGFRATIADASADGLSTLSEAIAFMVWLALAGLPWWTLIAALTLITRRIWRSANKAKATEPPPAL